MVSESALNPAQLEHIESALHGGSEHASKQLAKWLDRASVIQLDALRYFPLAEATELLANGDEPICFCAMAMQGQIGGQMILAFDDSSGLELADMVLGQPAGTTTEWSELAMSAVLETTNIVCCAYLNALTERLGGEHSDLSLVPEPPEFSRDYAQSLMQFALMDQALEYDRVILAETQFNIEGQPVHWNLLFVPDGESLQRLSHILSDRRTDSRGGAGPAESGPTDS